MRPRLALMRRAHRKSCGRKIGYDTIRGALDSIERVRKLHKLKGPLPQVYLCTNCNKFHWGHGLTKGLPPSIRLGLVQQYDAMMQVGGPPPEEGATA